MDLTINGLTGGRVLSSGVSKDDGGEFLSAIMNAVGSRQSFTEQETFSGTTIISPKFEQKLRDDSELREAFSEKISSMTMGCGNINCKDDIVIVARDGNIIQYCLERERNRFKKPDAEELKSVARARARKRAKLSAYFRRLQRYGIKRKLVEQENAKRVKGKKFRSVSKLNTITDSLTTIQTPLDPELFF